MSIVEIRLVKTAFFPYAVLLQVTPIVAISPLIRERTGAGALTR